ncbi:MAG: hypothetical protein LVO36_02470 [Nitrosopumilus sp. (ex Thoosa mismalolli)]|nr:hypothetical protein [Nitrosopumilus sp. (ex Thoosa mismalolli)]
MSEEFVKLATDEINQAIAEMEKTFSSCSDDEDTLSKSNLFQKESHKIKGLAPMMGQEERCICSNFRFYTEKTI